jgi:universal stress protein A
VVSSDSVVEIEMNIKKILCPIDFSDFNKAANAYASLLAKSMGAEIVYLHVYLPDVPFGSYAYVDPEQEEKLDLKQLKKIQPTEKGVKASHVVECGPPTDRIVEYANENEIDLIVMGTHGRTGLGRLLMGSVAEAVVRKADCPVLALKSTVSVPSG